MGMGQEEIKPPAQIAIDWNYFLKHLDSKKGHISSYFDKESWKINTMYRVRVSHVYDPSHIWIVHEEKEIDAFHKYLYNFYSKYKMHYKIPCKNFKINMYCITYTDGAFYRSILVNVPFSMKNESWAFVFLIDFGYMAKVSRDEIYFMTAKMYTVPQLAVRATLSGVGPIESTTWSANVVSKFSKLVYNKVLLCQITNKNYAHKVLFVRFGEYNWNTKEPDPIVDILVSEKLAKQISILDVREMKQAMKSKKSKRNKKNKLPFFLPTFDEIESGTCIDSVLANKFLDYV